MRYLILAVLAVFSFPALAQDEGHTIRIIQEDGSVDVIDLRQSAPAPEPVVDAPVETPKVEKGTVPVKKAKKASSKKSAPEKVAAVPLPPPLPVQRKVAPLATEEGAENAPAQRPEIRRAQAISVALDYAPPSSDVEVYRSEYKGQSVFVVMFKVEDGYHEVLVDAYNGKVLDSRKSDIMRAQPKPGHLPGSLQ
ncbi:MAG: PepSY domain-containing protein [Rhodospirillales bacterium]|nr:PepSY domain-containing protein [Alphaproteobacteria bacterium]MCB9981146.1 PepSY domain-containing protein [Rhodospirillales bacterium]